jgi:hypothetical protein
MVGEMYHNCKWCRCFESGKCSRSSDIFDRSVRDELYELAESGKLSEAIKESVKIPKLSKLERTLAWYDISQKRQKEILQAVRAELEEFIPDLAEGIDDSVSKLISNLGGKAEDLEIRDPESFYCKYFE